MNLRSTLRNPITLCLRCFAVSCAVLLAACTSQPKHTLKTPTLPSEQAASLNNAFEQSLEKDSLDLKQAAVLQKQYQQLLAASPEYVPAQIGLYRLNYAIELDTVDIDNEQEVIDAQVKLLRQYIKMPKAARQELLPPTMLLYQAKYADYVINSNDFLRRQYMWATGKRPRNVTKDDLYKLILLSAKTSPENHRVRAMAAEHAIETGHDRFGIAALKEMIAIHPNAILSPSVLADYYFNTAWNSSCSNDHQDSLRQALTLYKDILAKEPSLNLAVRKQTARIYALLDLKPLALNEAKILADSDDYSSLSQAAVVYTVYSKFDLAQSAFDKAGTLYDFKNKPLDRIYSDFLMASGRWQEAKEAYKKYLANRSAINSWDTLYAALLAKKLQALGDEVSYQDISSAASQLKTDRYQWPELLNKVLHGATDYPEPATLCQQQQLDFYKGASAIFNNGDKETAKSIADALDKKYMKFWLEQKLIKEILLAQ